MRRTLAVLWLFAAASLSAQAGPGASNAVAVPAPPAPVGRAGIRTGDIRIDGVIDESAWEAAPLISGMVESEPIEGAPAKKDTNVRILFDGEAIYFAARMWDTPDSITKVLNRRDDGGPSFDWLGFQIDPNRTRRQGYGFRVNAAGVQQDMFMSDDTNQDPSWNSVWESAVQTDSLGWTAEFRIPLSQIRYDKGDGGPQTWGFNIQRRRTKAAELTHYALMSRKRGGASGGGLVIVSSFAALENVVLPRTVRRVEMRPYVLSQLHRGPAEDGDPFFDGSASRAQVGSDFRLGLGSAFTVDATVNPDFGQVEADPAVINLSAFESFFEERRPFFVEGGQVFDFPLSGSRLFYSRRIGRAPHGGAPAGSAFDDLPDGATILGAAKLTGRTPGGLSLGALSAMTQEERGRAYFLNGSTTSEFMVEPRTTFGAFSARQDLRAGATQVSGILTAVQRDLPESGEFNTLVDRAYTAGARFDHQWSDHRWRLWGFLAGSDISGTPAALTAVQRSSIHYFQRPDATRARLDTTLTSLAGREWRLELDKQNSSVTGGAWLAEISKGFEINDLGFSSARERLDGGVRLGYLHIKPGKVFRDYNLNFQTLHNFSHEALDRAGSWDSWRRAYVAGSFNLSTNATLLSYHSGNLNLSYTPDQFSRFATRGGPVMIQPGTVGGRFGINLDRRQPYTASVSANYQRASHGSGSSLSLDGSVMLHPSPPLQLQIEPSFSVLKDGTQYVTSTTVQPYAATYGKRYFFGELERRELSLETRVNFAFSSKVTFQLYNQALLSSGDYVRYKQLAAPGTYDFRSFTVGSPVLVGTRTFCTAGSMCEDASGTQWVDLDGNGTTDFSFADKDFNVRSLIGNAVFRWEYRPGSTLFFVWQRVQSGDATLGDFDFGRDTGALFDAPAQDRFIVKLNYWLGL